MNKKIVKYIAITFILFTSFIIKTKAATVWYGLPYDDTIRNAYSDKSKNIYNSYYTKGIAKTQRYLTATGVYAIGNEHAYCIQPGTTVTSGSTANASDFGTYSKGFFTENEDTKRACVRKVLTFATKLSNPKNYPKKSVTYNEEIQKVFAAQILIWECVTGERTNFSKIEPQNRYSTSTRRAYDVIKNNYTNPIANTNGRYKTFYTEYQNIINKVHAVFETVPKGTSAAQTGTAKTMKYNETTGKWSLKLGTDANYKYWKVKSSGKATVTVSSDSVYIESSEPITNGIIELTNKISDDRTSETPSAFIFTNSQDVVTISGQSRSIYIKVSTEEKPTYQLSITKYETDTTNPIKGVEFKVYANTTCTGSVLKTITTDENGIAKITNLEKTGTYCAVESKTPAGYDGDSTPHTIQVTTDNKTTPANITVYNAPIILELEKYTVDEEGNRTKLDDNCGEDYNGPEFTLKNKAGNLVCLTKLEDGKYTYTTDCDSGEKVIRTCDGEFTVSKLPECVYTITETKLPEGKTGQLNIAQTKNICSTSDRAVTFVNGFSGVEFRKKNEQGEYIDGGIFTLKKNVNGVYKEVGLMEESEGLYSYSEDDEATFAFETSDGKALIKGLGPGEYEIIENEAPEGYELSEGKSSKVTFKITSNSTEEYQLVELTNRKSFTEGSSADATLIVKITTGRKVLNYVLIFGGLSILLVIALIIRKKLKK